MDEATPTALRGVVASVPADEPQVAGFLEGERAPPVYLLLVDAAFRVKRAGDLGRVHEVGEHRGCANATLSSGA